VRAGGASRTKLLLSLLLAVAIFAFLFRRAGELLERRWPAITAVASSATCRCTWCCW
jgi:hypothetical protein